MNKLIADEITANSGTIKYCTEKIAELLTLPDTFDAIDLSDCSFSAYKYGTDWSVNLQLKEDKRDSHLPHAIAQAFSVRMAKTQNWDKRSLIYTSDKIAMENGGSMVITVNGSVPATCRLEITEEPIPEDQLIRVRRVTKIVCDPEPTSSAPEEATANVGAEKDTN